MTALRFDKSSLPSRHVSVGAERAPHRSYYYAMGLTEEDIIRLATPVQAPDLRSDAAQVHPSDPIAASALRLRTH